MKLKKMAVIGAIGMVSILLLTTGCNRHKRFHGERIQKVVLEKMDDLADDLKLNKSQKGKYYIIRSYVKSDMIKHHKERLAFAQQIKVEVEKEKPDMDKIIGLVKEKEWDHKKVKNRYADDFLKFYNILDDKQKAVIIKKVKKISKYIPSK